MIYGFTNNRKGTGFGKVMPGFHSGKKSTISSGDWDGDGVKNRGDCNAFNFRKQEGGEPFVEDMETYANRKLNEEIKENLNKIKEHNHSIREEEALRERIKKKFKRYGYSLE